LTAACPPLRVASFRSKGAAMTDHPETPPAAPGRVHLVGAGPGAADLLTLRALRLMQQADVVVYDRLVGPDVLELVPPQTETIFVGKMRDRHVLPQAGINQLLISLARAGKRVVRLKGGDPFIFGRGGEELEALAEAGIPFEVVPGITAALGCAAHAGVPLTHRDHAQTLVFVTGHTKDGEVELDWPALVRPHQTIVVYMGAKAVAGLCAKLVAHGLDPATPAALIENGTYRHQRTIAATVATLPELVPDQRLLGPALIVIGNVVGLRARLAWLAERADDGALAASAAG
jgi:uroporphyrin-III C-methyltransferase / precorrin-2 dehydrogenase / sirohydrochlorin ferrochelatase